MAQFYSNENFPIVCMFDPDFEGQALRIQAAVAVQPQLAGQLIRVNRPTAA